MADQNQFRISRDQLAKFLPDNDTVRRFEKLFAVASTLSPDDIQIIYALIGDLSIDLGTAGSRANTAMDSLDRLRLSIEAAVTQPGYVLPRSFPVDYLDFDQSAAVAAQVARMSWSGADDTLNIQHTGGVMQQVGQELYGRITNPTGAAFPNGAALGINPGTAGYALYIADGSLPSLNIVGIATETIAPGAQGRLTISGVVHDINTTGSAAGETWAVGDILYVSTAIAGGLTKVKPTAPNLSIPIGRVSVVSATVGQIAVRPIAEQQKFYGQFSKNTDQTPAAANTAYAILWTTAGIASGVAMGTPTSRVVTANPGLYRFNSSIQLTSSSATVKNVWLWYRKNGVDIPNSALITSLDSGTAIRAPSRSMLISMVAGDYVELMYASDSINITVDAVPATAFAPAAPAALMSVSQEQQ